MKYKALLLENEGNKFEENLLSALKQSDILNGCYAYKSRVKTEETLLEKVRLKRADGKENYCIGDITDVIGLRLITLFRIEMVSIFEKIIKLIKHEHELSPNPFKKNSISELIFYTNKNKDKINMALKDVAISLGVEDIYRMEQRDGEYSSIHIVTNVNKKISKLSTDRNTYYLPAEIQIRTVFEDAWGEVDHKYGYSSRKGKQTEHNIRNPQSVERHLDILKKFSDACGEYADAIHLEIIDSSTEDLSTTNIFSVESDQEIIGKFRSSNISNTDIDKYTRARALREMALKIKQEDTKKWITQINEAAILFRELSESYISDGKILDSVFYYYTRMNYAFCLISTNLKKEAEEALHIYRELESEYTDYPLIKMRLAQAYQRNGFIELALKKCDEAYLAYREIETKGFSPSEILPEVDYNHIRKYLPKVYGYQLWLKSEEMNPTSTMSAIKKANVLRKAYFLTEESLENDKNSPDLYNNLLYYAIQLSQIRKEFDKVKINKKILDSIESSLEKLKEEFDIEKTNDINTLDTLVKAYNYLGNFEDRDKIIKKMVPIAEKSLENCDCDHEITISIIKEAQQMMGTEN